MPLGKAFESLRSQPATVGIGENVCVAVKWKHFGTKWPGLDSKSSHSRVVRKRRAMKESQ